MFLFNLIAIAIRALRHHERRPEPLTPDEVNALLAELAAKSDEQLDWRYSVADLLKLLRLDSSFKARKELAAYFELDGLYEGTAEQNLWLRDKIISKVADHEVDSLRV